MIGLCLGSFQTEEYGRVSEIEEEFETKWEKYVEKNDLNYFGDLNDFRASRTYEPFSPISPPTEKIYLDSDNLRAVIGEDLRYSIDVLADSLMGKERNNFVEARVYESNIERGPETEQDKFLADFLYEGFDEMTFQDHSMPTGSTTWRGSRQQWEDFLEL